MAGAMLLAAAEEERLKRLLIIERRVLRQASKPLLLPEKEFVGHYRLRKADFEQLCEDIIPLLPVNQRTSAVRPEIKILAALAFYANGCYQKNIGAYYHLGLSQASVSLCLRDVTKALNNPEIQAKYIKFPMTMVEREAITKRFMDKHAFPGVVGCIDGTHVAIIRPSEDEEAYYNRKQYHSLNVLIHGGWWRVEKAADVTGSVAIEFGRGCYVSALDNGLFTVGAPRADGEGPAPEEIFTAFPAGDNKFALKSGYGKYVGVSKDGLVTGRSDAVGPMDQWEPVWEDGKTAILSAMNKFMSVCESEESVVARVTSAGAGATCAIRCSRSREVARPVLPEEEGNLAEVELNYVKKFQKFQDKRLRVNDGGVVELRRARNEGTLHETLLDRRSKMKADRYCK